MTGAGSGWVRQELCVVEDPALQSKFADPASHVAACHFPVADGEDLTKAEAAIEQEDAADAEVDAVLAGLGDAPGFTSSAREEAR